MAGQLGSEELRVDPLRRGLLTHCYRMLGSIHEAGTLVEQLVPPSADPLGLQPSGALDLYAVATHNCLQRSVHARPLPSTLVAPSDDPEGELAERPEITWLEPIPDTLAAGNHLGLEYITALQHLSPRQRAALILRDLENWPTTDVAAVLNLDPVEAEEVLTTARENFHPGPSTERVPYQRDLLERYAGAFEQYDVSAIVEFFAPDAIWEMPPFTSWFRGAKNIGRLISTHCPAEEPGDQVLVPIRANGQPGFAVYMRDPVDNLHRAFQLQVLTLTVTGIVHAVAFFDTTLFDAFGLPDLLTSLPESTSERPRVHVEYRGTKESKGE
ncbi:RNA polymerase sigma-70 factor (ECF subfamily) [Kribbella sp. VKM Ac-2527]|uniref:RNA polymerase sigma-70 factor (ECF subfamily) n=1 Tax=Kribbella caucasensis TaxID=2512215 RepID=A0A4R6J6T8_9ACTN|nr:RNA polymerase subunit sigma-70 [Kribbella sp. VKM Ac-2527]TDO30015.1 RNA polymerase sigma-70 factor (ECF subfamily) [Kribbella sp. VKM Ac-2527]